MNAQDLVYKIAVTLLPQVGPVTARNLISYCGGVKEVFETPKNLLAKIPNVGPSLTASILEKSVLERAETELEFIVKNNIKVLFYLDEDYPKRLTQLYDAPVLLYFKGDTNLNPARTVGIVGTRTPTPQGISNCELLIEELKKYDVQIISGLAFGIDGTAHRKSVEQNISNLGVVAHGLDRIYPAEHKSLASNMMKCGGILSEFPSNTIADRERFPMRNRIIAGLSDALIVIETAQSGGSMITADMAFNYNKDIFTFPGRVQDKFSKGCNLLIKRQRASLIESADDLAYQMMWDKLDQTKTIQKSMFVELSPEEKTILDLLQAQETGIDELSYKLSLSPSIMASVLLEMEFKGLVKSIPGKRFIIA